MARLRSGNAPTPARPAATTGRSILREKTNTTTGTPGPAVETSMLALKNFKRRPRQGSMLEMVRKRRSSVQASLISAQPQQDEGDVEDTSVFDLGSASEGEDVFAPEAEGTPSQLSKTKKPVSTRKSLSAKKSVATTPAVKKAKRKSDEMETESPHSALEALRRKHRKSGVQQLEDEPLPSLDDEHQFAVRNTPEQEASPLPNPATSDVQVINSSPESTPPTEPSSTHNIPGTEEADFAVPSTEEQERTHTIQQPAHEEDDEEDDLDTPNATMAEPASSSPNGTPVPETQRTDIYADPLTQLSPPPPEPAKTRSKGNKKPAAMSTATLRALLPRRTQRPQPRLKRTEYDISSDEEEDATAFDTTHLDDDEDELGGRIRRQKTAPAPSKGKKAAAAKGKAKQSLSTRKPSAPLPPAKSKGKGKAKATRTYGRATASDKENAGQESSSENDQADTSMSMREVAHSKELEEARRKFAEVDNWDLTFESMSNEDHRSSSQGWR